MDAGSFAELRDGGIPQMKLIALLDPRNHSYTPYFRGTSSSCISGLSLSRAQGMCPPRAMLPPLEQLVVPGTPEARAFVGLLQRTVLTSGLRGCKRAALCSECRQSREVESEPSHLLQAMCRCMRLFILWIWSPIPGAQG